MTGERWPEPVDSVRLIGAPVHVPWCDTVGVVKSIYCDRSGNILCTLDNEWTFRMEDLEVL